jgi:hypothetical protein
MAVLFELLAACVADTPEDEKKKSRLRRGYDARHRVALRLLATWLDITWLKVVCNLALSFSLVTRELHVSFVLLFAMF